MQQNISEKALYEILGTKLHDNGVIDAKIEEAYKIIRQTDKKANAGHKKKGPNKVFIGLGSAAAVLVLTFAFCMMNPVMASEIPVFGDLFAKVAEVFPFGRIPEEKAESLYAEGNDLYQVREGDITVTLEEAYVSNQALFLGIRIENAEEFPEMAAYVESGTQWLDVRTKEDYSFNPEQIMTRRRIEGKFEDAHTFIGVMRIADDEIPEFDGTIPESFDMTLEIMQIIGTLKNPTRPEGMISDEELAKMSDEELAEYWNSLPRDWVGFPNVYEHWFREGSWTFSFHAARTDDVAKVITLNEADESGLGIESIELSTMEMTVHTIEKTADAMRTLAFDADGNEIEYGGSSGVYIIAGHDISTVSIYICRWDDWEDAMIEYENPENDRRFRELIEACALFSVAVDTTK